MIASFFFSCEYVYIEGGFFFFSKKWIKVEKLLNVKSETGKTKYA